METKIGNITFQSCIWNASGVWGTYLEEMKILEETTAGAIVMKSCTKHFRNGNPEPRLYVRNDSAIARESIISVGLANNGWDYYINCASRIKKPTFISEGGLAEDDDLAEFITKVNDIQRNDVLIEFNFSCPNIVGHIQPGYDFQAFQHRIQFIRARIRKPWGIKLPPYHDATQIRQICSQILVPASENGLCFITCCNSMGAGLMIDTADKETLIRPNNGLGGIGGQAMKPIALGNTWCFYNNLPPQIAIIGCGGVSSGKDVLDFILAGAIAVEVGTACYSDCSEITRISKEFSRLIGDVSINQLRGQLSIPRARESSRPKFRKLAKL